MISAEIIEGIVIGVSSGIILSLFFGGKNYINKHVERRDQIKFLAQILVKNRDLIFNAKSMRHPLSGIEAKREEVRKAYFEDMRRQLESVLQNRASRLSYDEIKEVKDIFFTDLFPDVVLNEKGYESIFNNLEAIKWLNLPPRTN